MLLILAFKLQDKGYDNHFVGKKVYVKHSSWKKVRQIGDQSNKLYRLQIAPPMALIGSDNSSGKEMNELCTGEWDSYTMDHSRCSKKR